MNTISHRLKAIIVSSGCSCGMEERVYAVLESLIEIGKGLVMPSLQRWEIAKSNAVYDAKLAKEPTCSKTEQTS
jgi:hypothetical protein